MYPQADHFHFLKQDLAYLSGRISHTLYILRAAEKGEGIQEKTHQVRSLVSSQGVPQAAALFIFWGRGFQCNFQICQLVSGNILKKLKTFATAKYENLPAFRFCVLLCENFLWIIIK